MSDGYLSEKKKNSTWKTREWFVDSVLVCLYSIFLLGCTFLAIFHKDWGFWYGFGSILLFSACIGFVHYNLNRTAKVFILASALAIALGFVPIAFLFPTEYSLLIISGRLYSLQEFLFLTVCYPIYMLVPSILGGIIGYFFAEKRKE